MRFPSLIVLATLLAAPAFAGETPWQEVAPGVKLRLISTGQIRPDGTTMLGLEIDMPETSKTYWRVPGETGLPTELDFAGSTGVGGYEIVWPYPTRDVQDGYLDYVYFGPTVLPLDVKVEPGAEIKVSAVLGVCSDICVPAQARFSLAAADSEPDRANGLRIRQALALAPIAWGQGPQPIGSVEYRAGQGVIAIDISDPDLDPMSLIVATESGEPLFGAPQKSPEPNLVLVPVLGKSDEIDLENQDVRLTFMTGTGSFEVTRPVTLAPEE